MLPSKMHRPWRPRMDDGQIFNPFAHTTEPEASLADHQSIETEDAEAPAPASPQHDEQHDDGTAAAPQSGARGADRA